jgi:hypothetical protein
VSPVDDGWRVALDLDRAFADQTQARPVFIEEGLRRRIFDPLLHLSHRPILRGFH